MSVADVILNTGEASVKDPTSVSTLDAADGIAIDANSHRTLAALAVSIVERSHIPAQDDKTARAVLIPVNPPLAAVRLSSS